MQKMRLHLDFLFLKPKKNNMNENLKSSNKLGNEELWKIANDFNNIGRHTQKNYEAYEETVNYLKNLFGFKDDKKY